MSEDALNWPKIGNEKAVEFLRRVAEAGQPAQAYVFLGQDDLGKSTIALTFARQLMAASYSGRDELNADLHILKPEEGKKSISIEQVRELIKSLQLGSFLDSYKIGLVKEADTLTAEAQSALLKTLEEPEEKVVLILLADSEESLLPTILSRAQKLYFQSVPAETIYDYLIAQHNVQRPLAKDLANIALGRPLKAVRFLENPDLYTAYLAKAAILLQFFAADVNRRLTGLDQMMSDRTYSAAAVAAAEEIILMFEGLLRDLFLLHFNQPEKIQHSALKDELEKVRQELERLSAVNSGQDNFSIFLLQRFKLAAMAREYLAANVNPRLVLEQLCINL